MKPWLAVYMNISEMNRKFMKLETEHFWGSSSKVSLSTDQREYKFWGKMCNQPA